VSWNGKRIATVEDFDPSTGDLKLNKNSKTVILDENQVCGSCPPNTCLPD
jgi:hypothetical protein